MNKIDLYIIISVISLIIVLLLTNYTSIDIAVQNHLFNFTTQKWLIDAQEPFKKLIFYRFPKIIYAAAIIFLIISLIVANQKKRGFFWQNRQKFTLIFLGLALIPLTVGNIKKFTNIYCPAQYDIYGGKYPYHKIFEKSDENINYLKKGQCFPAGHVVTAFSLFILFFALEKKSNKLLGLFSAFVLGCILGFYQMAKGAHFLSDNLASMISCFLMAALITRLHRQRRGE